METIFYGNGVTFDPVNIVVRLKVDSCITIGLLKVQVENPEVFCFNFFLQFCSRFEITHMHSEVKKIMNLKL